MAHAVEFEESDNVMESLSARMTPLPIKTYSKSSVSCWELNSEELAEVQRTGRIWLRTDTFRELRPHESGEDWQPAIVLSPFKSEVLNGQWVDHPGR
jgi:hypothetical protein